MSSFVILVSIIYKEFSSISTTNIKYILYTHTYIKKYESFLYFLFKAIEFIYLQTYIHPFIHTYIYNHMHLQTYLHMYITYTCIQDI